MTNKSITEDSELQVFMSLLGYEPETTTKDHRVVTRFKDSTGELQNVSRHLAARIMAFSHKSNQEAVDKYDHVLTSSVIRSTFMSQYIYSKIQFDNAKDTTALFAAAESSAEMLEVAMKSKMVRYIDQLVDERMSSRIPPELKEVQG